MISLIFKFLIQARKIIKLRFKGHRIKFSVAFNPHLKLIFIFFSSGIGVKVLLPVSSQILKK